MKNILALIGAITIIFIIVIFTLDYARANPSQLAQTITDNTSIYLNK